MRANHTMLALRRESKGSPRQIQTVAKMESAVNVVKDDKVC
jgi:hypothetical protein